MAVLTAGIPPTSVNTSHLTGLGPAWAVKPKIIIITIATTEKGFKEVGYRHL